MSKSKFSRIPSSILCASLSVGGTMAHRRRGKKNNNTKKIEIKVLDANNSASNKNVRDLQNKIEDKVAEKIANKMLNNDNSAVDAQLRLQRMATDYAKQKGIDMAVGASVLVLALGAVATPCGVYCHNRKMSTLFGVDSISINDWNWSTVVIKKVQDITELCIKKVIDKQTTMTPHSYSDDNGRGYCGGDYWGFLWYGGAIGMIESVLRDFEDKAKSDVDLIKDKKSRKTYLEKFAENIKFVKDEVMKDVHKELLSKDEKYRENLYNYGGEKGKKECWKWLCDKVNEKQKDCHLVVLD